MNPGVVESVVEPNRDIAAIPMPRQIESFWGWLDLGRGLRVAVDQEVFPQLQRLRARFQARFDALLQPAADDAPVLRLRVAGAGERIPQLGVDESYQLRVTSAGAELESPTPLGAAHGLERLLQLVERRGGGPGIPALRIEDAPHFPWRGLLLDPARHPLDLNALLRTLDGMAALGLNVLHLHLNDDQGFAIECPSCPELHQRSGGRGHLGTGEVQRLVSEAAERGIRVLPELDVPGHAGAILRARPDLAAGEAPDRLPVGFGPSRWVLDPTRQETWALLEAVVGDLALVFPERHFHLGGDEVHPKAFVFEDARRRQWMHERGISDARGVQDWFLAEMAALLIRHDRVPVGWDEVLEGAVPDGLVVQNWRAVSTLQAAVQRGHDALFSSGYYLDLAYPAALHYGFDPAGSSQSLASAQQRVLDDPRHERVRTGMQGLVASAPVANTSPATEAAHGRVLGGEACLWGELVTDELLDGRLYGRLPAVAERLWGAAEDAHEDQLYARMPRFLAHLEATTACRPITGFLPMLLRLGVLPGELHHVRTVMAALEPVRWYQRLLGAELLQRRLQGQSGLGANDLPRPYDASTALTSPVDLLQVESLDAREFSRDLAAANADPRDANVEVSLRDRAHRWRMAFCALDGLRERSAAFAQLGPCIDALNDCADVLEEWLDDRIDGRPVSSDLVQRLDEIEGGLTSPGEVELVVLVPLKAVIAPTNPESA